MTAQTEARKERREGGVSSLDLLLFSKAQQAPWVALKDGGKRRAFPSAVTVSACRDHSEATTAVAAMTMDRGFGVAVRYPWCLP